MTSPLDTTVMFEAGPVPITRAVLTTWGIIALLTGLSFLATRRLSVDRPGRWQSALELFVTSISKQIEEFVKQPPEPFLPLLATLFLFLVVANLASLVPGVMSPTAQIETAAALAAIVFVAVRYYGIKLSGLVGHLKSFANPTVFAIPLNIIGEFSRTLALTVRLFGNIMSGQFLIAVVISLAGLLVPLPLMALSIVTGVIQAYIFTILAAVFIAAGIHAIEPGRKGLGVGPRTAPDAPDDRESGSSTT